MKNRFLKLLTLTLMTASLLAGCGGNEASEDAANKGTENNVVADTEETASLATVRSGVNYIETDYYFVVPGEEYLDDTYVDGEELDITSWEMVKEIITIHGSIDMFDGNKNIMGYLKPEIECIHYKTNGEWSAIVLGTDFDNKTGTVIVRAEDLNAVAEMVSVAYENGVYLERSDKAETLFDKIRAGIAETNAYRESYAAENPNVPYEEIVEADSSDGMECIGTVAQPFDDEQGIENIVYRIAYENNSQYTQYYLDYVKETETYVEFNVYAK